MKFSHSSDPNATVIAAEHALWPGHGATDDGHQRRPSQAERLLQMLRQARAQGEPLALPAIMQAGLAQHSARILELRRKGHRITNEMVRIAGVVRSSYRLEFDAEAGR